MPQAHGTIWGAFAPRSRKPVGIGIPSARPIGTSMATEMSMRAARGNGIAHVMIGPVTATTATPMSATPSAAAMPARASVAGAKRRLHAAPSPVPSSSEKRVTVNE